MTEHSHGGRGTNRRGAGGGAGRYVFWGFILIGAYFLVMEHRAHVVQYLPFLLILACPLLHLLHGHGGHEGHHDGTNKPAQDDIEKDPAPGRHGGH